MGPRLRRDLSEKGTAAGLVMPYCDSQAMNQHLKEISAQVEPGHHAVVRLDQAGWHTFQALRTPANMTLLPLLAKAPELNPVENLWQFMRDNYLSNRIFQNYDDIVDHCCEAWNKIAEQSWRIMSIGVRDWAQGYSSAPVGISGPTADLRAAELSVVVCSARR
jgi:hypothetical protein